MGLSVFIVYFFHKATFRRDTATAMAVFFLTKKEHNDILKAYYHIIPFDINCNGKDRLYYRGGFFFKKLNKYLKSC